MPAKNTVKVYAAGAYYHVYNRGVEKRVIFTDRQDYHVFLSYLKEAILPPPDPKTRSKNVTFKGETFKGIPRLPKNFHKSIELIAFALMPNHFHLLLKQTQNKNLNAFMQSVATRYSIYFNKRHKRVGSLYQGVYKAVLIDSDEYLLHLSRYIHRNPIETAGEIENTYSSYKAYIGKQRLDWINPKPILDFFSQTNLPILKQTNSYKMFVEDTNIDDAEALGNLALDTL